MMTFQVNLTIVMYHFYHLSQGTTYNGGFGKKRSITALDLIEGKPNSKNLVAIYMRDAATIREFPPPSCPLLQSNQHRHKR